MRLRRLLPLWMLVLGGCALIAAGQTAPSISAPAAPAAPGVYLLASSPGSVPGPLPGSAPESAPEPESWIRLDSIQPSNVKAERSTLSMLAGATQQPTLAEYIGAQAQFRTADRQPVLCVNRVETAADPVLVRLKSKKDKNVRDLDIGAVRATLMVGASLAQAGNSDVVPMNEAPRGDGCDLLQPARALPLGEYGIIFGPDDLAVYAFGVQAEPKPRPARSALP